MTNQEFDSRWHPLFEALDKLPTDALGTFGSVFGAEWPLENEDHKFNRQQCISRILNRIREYRDIETRLLRLCSAIETIKTKGFQ